MYTGYKPSSNLNKSVISQNTRGSAINQSQLESLQRQVDNYTRKLEQEKRKRFGIEEALLMVTQQHHRHAQKLKELKIKSQSSSTFLLHVQIKNYQNQLQQAIAVYDQTVSHNNNLKNSIDQLRKEKKNFMVVYESLKKDEQQYIKQISKKKAQNEKKEEQNKFLKQKIVELQKKNEMEKSRIVKDFESLEQNYKNIKRKREEEKKQDSQQKQKKIQSIDTQPVLKLRLKKLMAKNIEKVKIMDQYQKKMKLIAEAFNQIKAGSGISDIEQITNTFIKSEEQNYSLYNYVDNLSQNIDNLTEQNKILQKKIAQLEKQNQQRRKIMSGTPEEQLKKKRIQKLIKQKEGVIDQLKKLVQSVQPQLQKTLLELARSKYNDDPNKLFDYEIGFNINQTNIEQYLADLQKYVNILIEIKCADRKTPIQLEMYKESPRIDNRDDVLNKILQPFQEKKDSQKQSDKQKQKQKEKQKQKQKQKDKDQEKRLLLRENFESFAIDIIKKRKIKQ